LVCCSWWACHVVDARLGTSFVEQRELARHRAVSARLAEGGAEQVPESRPCHFAVCAIFIDGVVERLPESTCGVVSFARLCVVMAHVNTAPPLLVAAAMDRLRTGLVEDRVQDSVAALESCTAATGVPRLAERLLPAMPNNRLHVALVGDEGCSVKVLAFGKLVGYCDGRPRATSRDGCACDPNGAMYREPRLAENDDDLNDDGLATAVGLAENDGDLATAVGLDTFGVVDPWLKQVGLRPSIECTSDETHRVIEPGKFRMSMLSLGFP